MISNVLLICPDFRGYNKSIVEGIKSLNINVVEFSYSENNVFNLNLFWKVYYKLATFLIGVFFGIKEARTFRYNSLLKRSKLYPLIIESVDLKDIDMILIVKGFGFTKEDIMNLKEKANSPIHVYQWDSHFLYPGIESLYQFVDKVFYFEKSDNAEYIYLPNFHKGSDSFNDEKKQYKYSLKTNRRVVYIGGFSLSRWFNLFRIRRELSEYVFCDFRLVTSFRLLNVLPFVSTKLLIGKEVEELYNNSAYGLEIENMGQQGFTQRVLEYLNANTYIVVPNTSRKDYLIECGITSSLIVTFEQLVTHVIDDSRNHNKEFSLARKNHSNLQIDNWLREIFNLRCSK